MKDKEFKFRLSNELYEILNIKAKDSNKSRSDYLRTFSVVVIFQIQQIQAFQKPKLILCL